MALISVIDVSKVYENSEILQDITFSIGRGERVALVGRSGSGKSTIVRIICGLETPTSGKVTRGNNIHTLGYAPQSPSLLHAQNIKDNILLPVRAAMYNNSEYAESYSKIVATLGLEDLQFKYPYQLSRGQAQRASLARALILRPEALILDEPFASLDEFTKEEMDDILLELNRVFNTAILLVTHSIEEAVYIAKTVHVLSETRPGLSSVSVNRRHGLPRSASVNTPEFIKAVREVRSSL